MSNSSKLVITEYAEVPFLATFRYNKEWCVRHTVYNYFSESGEELLMGDMKNACSCKVKRHSGMEEAQSETDVLVILAFYSIPPKAVFRARRDFWIKDCRSSDFAKNLKTGELTKFLNLEICAVHKKRLNPRDLLYKYGEISKQTPK